MKSIPEELINEIVSHFTVPGPAYDDFDLKTLSRLARVSKQFHRIVQPHLYTHLRGGSHGRSARLLETIQKNPWLGLHAKSLNANGSTLTDHLQSPTGYLVRDLENASLKQVRRFYKAHFRQIMLYLPNLECLDVSKPKHRLRVELGELPPWLDLINYSRTKLLCGGPTFDNLKRLDADIHRIQLIELYNVFSLPQLEMLTLTGGTMDYSREMTVMTRRRYSAAWNFRSRTLKLLHFVGLEPGHGPWPMQLLAKTVPPVQDLSFIGTEGRGYGSNLYRILMGVFLPVITGPNFHRLEMWDIPTTPPDQWSRSAGWNHWGKVFNRSPVKILVVDANIIAAPGRMVFLPNELEEFWLRSNVSATARFTQEMFNRYVAGFKSTLILDQHPTLERCYFILQKTDIFARELFKEGNRAAFEKRGVEVHVLAMKERRVRVGRFGGVKEQLRAAVRWAKNRLGR